MSAKLSKSSPNPQCAITKPTSRFIIIHGDKGGVGKSFVAQALADLFYGQGTNIAIIEADTANPDVERMFATYIPCTKVNLREEDGWMDLMDFIVRYPGYTFVMNTPAGIGEAMRADMITFSKFLSTYDAAVKMEMWWAMNVNHDSVNLFDKAVNDYGNLFSRINVVCNLHFSDGNYGPFFLWHESPLRTKIEKNGGLTIKFPGLSTRVIVKLFSPKNVMPFADAVDAVTGEKVDLMYSERFKLLNWRSEVNAAFSPAFPVAPLIPLDVVAT